MRLGALFPTRQPAAPRPVRHRPGDYGNEEGGAAGPQRAVTRCREILVAVVGSDKPSSSAGHAAERIGALWVIDKE